MKPTLPPPCMCQHPVTMHHNSTQAPCNRPWCLCRKYQPDNHTYPNGLVVTS